MNWLRCFLLVLVCFALSARLLHAQDAEPLLVYSGDGLEVIISELLEETGEIKGQIQRGNDRFPFTGKISEDGEAEIVRGNFVAGSERFPFTSRQEADSEIVNFTTGGKTYRLRPKEAGNPLTNTKPDVANPLAIEARPLPAPVKTNQATEQPPVEGTTANTGENLPPVMRVKLHTFPDVTMGGVVSHTVVLPEGWTSRGQTEWSTGELAYPQNKFEIDSPEGARIRFIPAMTLTYTEVNPVPGFDPIPPQGVPAPRDFPQWVVDTIRQNNTKVNNVVLVDKQRQPKIEEMHTRIQRETGANDQGMQREVWVITIEYDEAGIRRREDALMLYVRYAPIINQNLRSQMWSVFTSFIVSAPENQFAALKPQLYTIASSVRPTPQWFTQSQAVIGELSRIRAEERWKSIRRRGEMINQMTDADYARYRKTFNSDSAQRDRINTIYETNDFKDTDGQIVNLPMHYKHVFSDGKGNYVLSNNSLDKPGELWTPIEPMK